MGVSEEGAKVAIGFMDSMKREPLSLALVVMNFALLGFVYFQSSQFNAQRRENIALFVQIQGEVQKLLAQCIVPPPQQDNRRSGPEPNAGRRGSNSTGVRHERTS